jgi:hypothetical protein
MEPVPVEWLASLGTWRLPNLRRARREPPPAEPRNSPATPLCHPPEPRHHRQRSRLDELREAPRVPIAGKPALAATRAPLCLNRRSATFDLDARPQRALVFPPTEAKAASRRSESLLGLLGHGADALACLGSGLWGWEASSLPLWRRLLGLPRIETPVGRMETPLGLLGSLPNGGVQ